MLQQRAEQRRREQTQREDLRSAYEAVIGEPADDERMTLFLNELTVETGALPPLGIVLEAVRAAATSDVRRIGDEVRAYYRRPRTPTTPPPTPPAPVEDSIAEAVAEADPVPDQDPVPV